MRHEVFSVTCFLSLCLDLPNGFEYSEAHVQDGQSMLLIAIFAIYVIVTKRLRITRSITVSGQQARNFGIVLLVIMLPLSGAVGMVLKNALPRNLLQWPTPQILFGLIYGAAVVALAFSFRDNVKSAPEASVSEQNVSAAGTPNTEASPQ